MSPSCALRQFLTSARILAAKALGPVLQVIGGARTRPLLKPGERMLRAHRHQQWCKELVQTEDTVCMLGDVLLPVLDFVERLGCNATCVKAGQITLTVDWRRMLLEQHKGCHSNEQTIPRALALERGGVWNNVAGRRLIGEGHAADSLHARHILACASTHASDEWALHDDIPIIVLLHVAGMQLAWAWLAGQQMQVTVVEC